MIAVLKRMCYIQHLTTGIFLIPILLSIFDRYYQKMKPLSLLAAIILCSSATFAQSASIMAGTYTVTDTIVGHTPCTINLIAGIYETDSVDYFNAAGNLPILYVYCNGDSVFYNGGSNCSVGLFGYGTISPDYNHIYLTTATYHTLDGFSNPLSTPVYSIYTRTPLLTQEQIDRINKILRPEPAVITLMPQTNPVTQVVYFTINSACLSAMANIKIFNMVGECVYKNEVSVTSGEQIGINVHSFTSGMYILESTLQDNTTYRLKFIKQ